MSAVAAAVVAGGAIIGSVISSSAAGHAADQQAQSAQNAQNLQQSMFNQTTQNESPFLQAGIGATSNLNYLLGIGSPDQGGTSSGQGPVAQGGQGRSGFDPSSGWGIGAGGAMSRNLMAAPGMATATQGMAPGVTAAQAGGGFGSLNAPFSADMMKQYSPAYQFQMQQGQQGVLNQSAGASGALSGAALKDLTSFNQNYANTAFNNAFGQYQTQQNNTFSRLSDIAHLGQGAASNQATGASSFAGSIGNSAQNVGTALAGGTVGSANAIAGGINSATPWLYAGSGGGAGNMSQQNIDFMNAPSSALGNW